MGKTFRAVLYEIADTLPVDVRQSFQRSVERVLAAGVTSYTDLLATIVNRSIETDIRISACWVSLRLGNKSAASKLIIALDKEEELEVRQTAIKALGIIGGRKAVKPLVVLLNDDDNIEIRSLAASALGWTRDKRAFRPLINKLLDQNEHPQVRADIAEALANIGIKEAVPVLITLLEESSPEIRFWSAYALGQLGDPSAIPSLEKLAGDDIEVPGWWSVGKEASNAIEALRGQINTDPNK